MGPRLETWQHLKHHVPLTETKTARRRKTENLTELIFWIVVCVLVTSDDKWVDSSLTPWPCRLEEVRGNTFWCQEEAEEASSIFFWVCKMSPRLPRDGVTSSDSSHGRASSQNLLIYSLTTKKRTKSSRLKKPVFDMFAYTDVTVIQTVLQQCRSVWNIWKYLVQRYEAVCVKTSRAKSKNIESNSSTSCFCSADAPWS